MLIINPQSYKGRFYEQAKAMVQSGIRVGKMYVMGEGEPGTCHICSTDFNTPVIPKGDSDAWGECPYCSTKFIFIKALNN